MFKNKQFKKKLKLEKIIQTSELFSFYLPFNFIRLEIKSGDKTDAKCSLSAFSNTTKLQIMSSHVFKLPTSLNCFVFLNT